MKILAICEFDCAGVLAGHRRALRQLGVDYRVAARDVYRRSTGFPLMPDWTESAPGVTLGTDPPLRAFAEDADVIQFHPSIGQPWSCRDLAPRFDDGEDERLFGIAWKDVNPRARRVSLFHGSRNAAAGDNAEAYAAHWRRRGHEIWATTADYAARMRAPLAPPAVEIRLAAPYPVAVLHEPRAKLRGDDDPLVVVQAPTDPPNCHTEVFLDACRRSGAVAQLVVGRPHEEVIARKLRASAGFDHLRGAPSVNTIENLALGLAPLFALSPGADEALMEAGMGSILEDLCLIRDEASFRKLLVDLVHNPARTRFLQEAARAWYERCWTPAAIGEKLKAMYEELVS